MKKFVSLACIVALCVTFTGCSKEHRIVINNNIDETGQLLKDFAQSNGFKVASADDARHVYKIECLNKDLVLQQEAGFGVRLKELTPNLTVINAYSYGDWLNGYFYDKTGRYLKQLKHDGYTLIKYNHKKFAKYENNNKL
jgi:hypothetical protein